MLCILLLLSHGDPRALALQDQLTLTAHKLVDVGVDQLKAQNSGLRGSQVG